ncbi:hypothetical protein [Segnochrobactrum spirostomi]|uniref:hypothetical protein n=1 Tax=Segnochrobactrum spirostomi TaxID=2608987 RepID=UPI001AD842D2|nr:hypothetical protein [Segnochrobactrum spirostomi]
MPSDAVSPPAIAPSTGEAARHPLDDVVWNALHGPHRSLAEGGDEGGERACRDPAAVAPFAAVVDLEPEAFRSLGALIGPGGDQIALLSTAPLRLPPTFAVFRQEPIDQMVLIDREACMAPATTAFARLGREDVAEMLTLTGITQPGPFGPRTIELGTYLGARRDGTLAAMAGERLQTGGSRKSAPSA